jgi:hypothetical protein
LSQLAGAAAYGFGAFDQIGQIGLSVAFELFEPM